MVSFFHLASNSSHCSSERFLPCIMRNHNKNSATAGVNSGQSTLLNFVSPVPQAGILPIFYYGRFLFHRRFLLRAPEDSASSRAIHFRWPIRLRFPTAYGYAFIIILVFIILSQFISAFEVKGPKPM
ncbi:hypothetical membrane protein [Thermoplasma acidophilum]|uniref:Hypothetical membrane protein n=1 Tax=Thermoplasma acidophilum (strain ATCC 25905 / DSM 1728 / JCM 9062 / NBRC 15155 / AMRC-C165) TaxID=273075 RepID=Q9HJ46_THEAC|nr:hypothetical membrane protein [Thermoplasma acidophilum]